MFHKVRHPVFLTASATYSIMSQCATPHDIGTSIIIFRFGHHSRCLSDNSFQHTFGHAVGNLGFGRICEIAFKDVRHHVGNAACCLIWGKCECEFGIHHSKFRAQSAIGAKTYFVQAIEFGDNRVARPFTTSSRNCEHDTHGQRLFYDFLPSIKVPKIAVIRHTTSDGLCSIDSRATTNGNQCGEVFTATYLNAFIHTVVGRIGQHTSKFKVFNTCSIERRFHAVEESATHYRAHAINEQHTARAHPTGQFASFRFHSTAKDISRGGIVIKIVHILLFYFCFNKYSDFCLNSTLYRYIFSIYWRFSNV